MKASASGYILREARDGIANIEGYMGRRWVSVGDTLPGVGQVSAIEKRGADWVVVTAGGEIK